MASEVILFGFNLTTALPKISGDILNAVKEKLITDLGVSEFGELKYVEEKDIIDILKPIQARSLIKSFKSGNLQVEEEGSDLVSPNVDPRVLNPIVDNRLIPNVDARWAEMFEVNYDLIPREVMTPLKKGQRPHPSLRRSFIRHVADDIQKICKRPLKRDLLIISKKIVSKFQCLSDTFCDEAVGIGCESILQKLLVCCENSNRKKIYDKPSKISSGNIDDPQESTSKAGRKKKRLQSYGALNSCPDLPEDESEETQVAKQQEMKRMFTEEHKTFSAEKANALLNDTFYLQRKFVNFPKSIDFFISDWPLLLSKQGIFIHFRNLIGIDVENKFNDSFEKKTERILSVLDRKPDKDVQPCLIDLLDLLLNYFEEKKEFIMIEADSLVSKNEVEQLKHLPKTPCIISSGNAKAAETFMLCGFCGYQRDIVQSLGLLFNDASLLLQFQYYVSRGCLCNFRIHTKMLLRYKPRQREQETQKLWETCSSSQGAQAH